ncbi:MAG: hypothetical protein IT193_02205 [Propionibacteriaceae bacterium]|nr:hypothetical protein [Propionibacteriaceae bacterium]
MCIGCGLRRVAWTRPRVDYCYNCLPGGPFTPPACRSCGSTGDYFSQGLCGTCHPRSPEHIDSCRGCLAWGVYPRYRWLCWSCRTWARFYPEGTCPYCGRTSRIGDSGACRLCYEQARMLQQPGRPLDFATANAGGQQLFFANLVDRRIPAPVPPPNPGWRKRLRNYQPYDPATSFDDHAWIQEPLFDAVPDPAAVRRAALVADNDLTRYCAAIVNTHADRYGWSTRQRLSVIHSLRVLQTLRPTPTAKIRASEVLGLRHFGGTTISTIDVLTDAGLLIEDIPTRLETYFTTKTGDLPPAIGEQLQHWMHILLAGSRQAPRMAPRDPKTVENYIRAITPALHAWIDTGHQTFAEITRDDITAAITAQPPVYRAMTLAALKTLFKVLKSRKQVFADPTKGLPAMPVATNLPLPLDTAAIRQALNSPDPAIALAVALVGFHALTVLQLRRLQLTDIVDGRLHLDSRDIPLAAPVRTRLAAWLDHRNRTWPGSINPHLLINRKTAPRLSPIGGTYPWKGTTVRPQALREDRILHEIHATGGDVRRLCDLFGLTVGGATRYLATIEHPGLARDHQVPRI